MPQSRVIDFHTHIYPETIAPRAIEGLSHYSGLTPMGDGTLTALLQEGKSAGITHFVLNSVATKREQVWRINTFLSDCAKLQPNCSCLATLHPQMSDDELNKEIERIIALGFRGVKLHPDHQGVTADSDGMMRICQRLSGRLPVLMHCGDYRNDLSHPRRVVKLLEAFPDLCMVAAHLGGWPIFDYALEYFEDKNCYLDLSSSIMFLGPRRSKELIAIYGAKRLIFGSDYPIFSPKQALAEYLALGLSKEQNELILHKNAEKVLHLCD